MTTTPEVLNQIKTFSFGVLLFLNIDQDLLKYLSILIIINMVMGGLKAIYLPQLKFELSEFFGGLVKIFVLLIIIMTVAILAKALGFNEFQSMNSILLKMLLLTKGIKIFNNGRSIYDKKEYKSSDFISIIIHTMTDFLGTQINKFLAIYITQKKEKK